MTRITRYFIGCFLACTLPAAAQMAQPEVGTVGGTGQVVLKKQPTLLRLNMVLEAEGTDLKEALQKLQEKRDQARQKLRELNVAEQSVVLGEPQIGDAAPMSEQMRMMQMMQRMTGGGGGAVEEKKQAKVSNTLRAEWPIQPGEPEQVLLAAGALQEQIRTALTETEEPTPEELEEMEEESVDMYMPDDGQPEAGQPQFVFVYKVPEQELSQALADAFSKAKAEAARVAAAAGRELGALRHLSASTHAGNTDEQQYAMRAYLRSMGESVPSENEQEAVGPQPTSVSYTVQVNASFELK